LRDRDKVVLPRVGFATVQNLIEFIYTGRVPEDEEAFVEFLKLGKKLAVKGLPTSGQELEDVDDVATEMIAADATEGKNHFYLQISNHILSVTLLQSCHLPDIFSWSRNKFAFK